MPKTSPTALLLCALAPAVLPSLSRADQPAVRKGQGPAPAVTVAAPPVSAETIERVVAVVNNEIILYSEVRERAEQLGQAIDDSSSEGRRQSQKVLRQVLDKMVDDALVLQQATELKLTVEEAEIDRAVEEIKKSNNLDGQQFLQALQEQGFTLASFRRDMRKQILRLKTINTAVRSRLNVSEEDLKAFYEQSVRQSGGHREAHIRHVLIAVPAGADARVIEAKRRLAAKLIEEARSGGDFERLARERSDDEATRGDGGDLGWVKEGAGLPEAMAEVIFSMDQKGEVRGPIKTGRGFEVLQLIDRREGDVRPFEEVREQIRAQLSQQQMEKQTQTWVQELRKKAHIEVRL